MVNIYVEIHPEHIEHIIVHFLKTYTVQQFLDLLKNKTNNGAFAHNELEIFCADEDGDLDDDFPPPNLDRVWFICSQIPIYSLSLLQCFILYGPLIMDCQCVR